MATFEAQAERVEARLRLTNEGWKVAITLPTDAVAALARGETVHCGLGEGRSAHFHTSGGSEEGEGLVEVTISSAPARPSTSDTDSPERRAPPIFVS